MARISRFIKIIDYRLFFIWQINNWVYNNIYLLGRNTIILLDIDYGYDDEKIINKIDNLKINKEEFSQRFYNCKTKKNYV